MLHLSQPSHASPVDQQAARPTGESSLTPSRGGDAATLTEALGYPANHPGGARFAAALGITTPATLAADLEDSATIEQGRRDAALVEMLARAAAFEYAHCLRLPDPDMGLTREIRAAKIRAAQAYMECAYRINAYRFWHQDACAVRRDLAGGRGLLNACRAFLAGECAETWAREENEYDFDSALADAREDAATADADAAD